MDRTWERGYRINIVSCVEWCELVHEINVVSGWKVASAGNPCAHLFCSPHVIAPWPGVDYPVRAFNGRKFLLLSEVTWFGGRNLFLGSAYLVTGVIAVIMGIILLLIHLLCSRWWENTIHCMVHTCICIAGAVSQSVCVHTKLLSGMWVSRYTSKAIHMCCYVFVYTW